jgi:hypothetical protein
MRKLARIVLAVLSLAAPASVGSTDAAYPGPAPRDGSIWREKAAQDLAGLADKGFPAAEAAFLDLQRDQAGLASSALLDAVIRKRSQTSGLSEVRDADGNIVQLLNSSTDSKARGTRFEPGPVPLSRVMELLDYDEVLIFVVPDVNGGFFFAVAQDDAIFVRLPPDPSAGRLSAALRCSAAAGLDPDCARETAAAKPANADAETRGAMSLQTATPSDFDFELAYDAYRRLIPTAAWDFLRQRKKLIFVSSAELLGLPWHLLITDPPSSYPWKVDRVVAYKQAPWLFKSFRSISVLPGISALEALRGERWVRSLRADSFLGVGDPVIGRTAKERHAPPRNCGLDAASSVDRAETSEPERRAVISASAHLVENRKDGTGTHIDVEAVRRQPRLFDTRCEVEATAQAFSWSMISSRSRKITKLFGGDATETKLKALNESGELSRYRVIHLATHGLVGGQLGADQSGIILTPPEIRSELDDGVLTAREIASMRLDADLVILSACSTAAGSSAGAEPLSGLASAFFAAGARSVLVSSWPVYSSAARDLITRMINASQGFDDAGNLDNGEALTAAMTRMLDAATSDFTVRPAYWAPFLLVGDPRQEEMMIMDTDDTDRADGAYQEPSRN